MSEEVEASAQGGRVPDHLSLRKDISFFAPIVPPSAETTNLDTIAGASQTTIQPARIGVYKPFSNLRILFRAGQESINPVFLLTHKAKKPR